MFQTAVYYFIDLFFFKQGNIILFVLNTILPLLVLFIHFLITLKMINVDYKDVV